MPGTPDATTIIDATLDAIDEDEVAALVGDVLREAWNGRRFDDDVLQSRLSELLRGEGAA